MALATSAALYADAPVVLLAADGDLPAQSRAASLAVTLGAPLLLAPAVALPARPAASPPPRPTDPASAAVRAEVERLGPAAVLSIGDAAHRWARIALPRVDVVAAPGELGDLGDALDADIGDEHAVPALELIDAVAALDRDAPAVLAVSGQPPPATPSDDPLPSDDTGRPIGPVRDDGDRSTQPAWPRVAPAEPLDALTVLVARTPAGIAATATARASGARTLVVGGTDPRADHDAIVALAEAPPGQVMALGPGFGPPDVLRRRVDVAATGVELPGGGQVVYPGRHMVALYGHPGTAALGVLGEQPVDGSIARAAELAAQYQPLVDAPVIPAFEIIATVASGSAGGDGNFSNETAIAELRPWVDAAREAGVYVVLDLQPGRTDFLTQARLYQELLAEPHVGLALDPEWRLGPNQRHLTQIGSVTAAEVNGVISWLADFTRQHKLPQKLLLLHQFQVRMISERQGVDTSRDELAVLIHADGFGTPGQKFDTWNALHVSPPPRVWWGWKNFIDEDQPTFNPAETMAISPRPLFVSYQ
jgi:hypothetical protein